uniref:Ig-like domain-containing protein n=1 Tax=Chrysemys picta bellii TaxID=8478 RepID=A0A8C3IZC5_CHRPI
MRIFPILGWMLFPGKAAVSVRGPQGGSVAVQCRYRTGYERYHKFWCREGALEGGGLFCSNGHIVETDGSEAEVTRDRVSIRDNHTQRVFTVTLEHLTRADAGTYHCGVERTGLDLRDTVEVTVSPGKSWRRSSRERGTAGHCCEPWETKDPGNRKHNKKEHLACV